MYRTVLDLYYSPVFVGLHHDLIGFPIRFSTDRAQALGHERSLVEGVVKELDLPPVLARFLLLLRVFVLDNLHGFLFFRRGVRDRGHAESQWCARCRCC